MNAMLLLCGCCGTSERWDFVCDAHAEVIAVRARLYREDLWKRLCSMTSLQPQFEVHSNTDSDFLKRTADESST